MRDQCVRVAMAMAVLGLAVLPAFPSTVLGLSIEDQARLSRFVVVGEVTGLAASDHPQHGIETAVTLAVKDVLKGDLVPGEAMVFHTRQGEVGGVKSEVPGEASLRVGQTVLVFVEEVEGRLYNLGLSMGVWSVLERDGSVTGFARVLTDGLEVVGEDVVELGPISRADMLSRVLDAATHPEFDHPLLRSALGPRR